VRVGRAVCVPCACRVRVRAVCMLCVHVVCACSSSFLVEIEIVMDERTPLRESHDCGILLQHKIEDLPSVERCFVHIDYAHRDVDDHDHNTPVVRKMSCASLQHTPPPAEELLLRSASPHARSAERLLGDV